MCLMGGGWVLGFGLGGGPKTEVVPDELGAVPNLIGGHASLATEGFHPADFYAQNCAHLIGVEVHPIDVVPLPLGDPQRIEAAEQHWLEERHVKPACKEPKRPGLVEAPIKGPHLGNLEDLAWIVIEAVDVKDKGVKVVPKVRAMGRRPAS